MDKIYIRDLMVRCIVGVNDDERTNRQDVLFNIVLSVDLARAGASDDFGDTVDYRAIKKEVMAMAEESSFFLVEALAEKTAALCLAREGVRKVRVTVGRAGARRCARSVAVEIERENNG